MHPFSTVTLAIFVAGYITARWDLVTRLNELAIFAWDHGVVVSRTPPMPSALQSGITGSQRRHCDADHKIILACSYFQTRSAKAFGILSLVFLIIFIPLERLATGESNLVRPASSPLRHAVVAH